VPGGAPVKAQTLRAYQSSALDELRTRIRAGKKRVLLVAPTGAGKTTIAAALIHGAVGMGHSVLFLAHRRELIDQCSERLDGAGVDHGVIMAGHDRQLAGMPVQIASVQTLARRPELPSARIVIVDEAHHARARTYGAILERFPDATVIGLTATPWRTDGRGLGELFEDLVVAARPRELIEQGHLVPFTGFAYDAPDVSGVEKKGGDFVAKGLELVMGERKLVGNIVEQWQAHARGARTVVFGVNRAHSEGIAERFRAAGIAAEHLDGLTPKLERAAMLARLRAGTTRVVSNVDVLTEGFDLPQLEVCVLARPTQSTGLCLQQVGRVMRPAPGKDLARIHDHAGCLLAHGMPDEDREYALDCDTRASSSKREALAPLRTCRECLRIFDAAEERCPACGYVNETTRKPPREVEGPQVEAIPIEELRGRVLARAGDESRFLAELRARASASGYSPKWVGIMFKERYGRWPRRTA
jgi:DNA repair protein RadD